MSKIAFLFAGQGSQAVGMGKDLYENIPAVAKLFDEAEKYRKGTLKQMRSLRRPKTLSRAFSWQILPQQKPLKKTALRQMLRPDFHWER